MPRFNRIAWAVLFAAVTAVGGSAAARADDCTLHVLGSARTYPGEADAWNQVFADFKAAYGCDVVARWEGDWSEIPQKLATARLAGDPVDIVLNGTYNSTLARSGVLLDLTDLVKPYADRFSPGTLAEFTVGDHVWAIPVSDSSTSAFFYNKTMFDEVGVTPPKTYADFLKVAAAIKAKKGIDALIHRGKDIYYWPMWYMEAFAQTSGDKSIQFTEDALQGKRRFDGPEEVAALTALQQFAKDGLLTQSTLDVDGEGARAAFLQQKAAMFYGGTWELAPLRAAKPSFDIGVFQFPLVVDKAGVVAQHGGGADNAYSIPSFIKPENIPHAAQFLEFLTRKVEAGKIISTYTPLIPSIVGVPPSNDPLAPTLINDFAPNTILYLDWIWPSEVNDAMSQAIPAVMFGGQTPEQAAASVQQALDTVKSEKDYRFDWWTTWTDADWAKVKPASIPTIEVKE
jgi:raffinose/stachyose/melibiose transport system substrate-binding protein